MALRHSPPYLPTSFSGVTTIGFSGRRSASGGRLPESTSALSIGASPVAATASVGQMPTADAARAADDTLRKSLREIEFIMRVSPLLSFASVSCAPAAL